MNKKFFASLLLVGLLAGCGENGNSSSSSSTQDFYAPSSSTTSETSSSSTSSTSSLPVGPSEVVIPEYGSLTAPTEGYALLITQPDYSEYYVSLTPIAEKDGQGRDQYFGDNISFNAGDTFKMYDGTNSTPWVEKALEPYGQYNNFTVTDEGIVCNVTGVYDIYAKFAWEDNTIYIGNQDGQ